MPSGLNPSESRVEVLANPKPKIPRYVCKSSHEERLLVQFWYSQGNSPLGVAACSRFTNTCGIWGNIRTKNLLFLTQPFRANVKPFIRNELGFLWAASNTVKAGVLGDYVLLLSALVTNGWYAWQDSNLRPVAPEATALSI